MFNTTEREQYHDAWTAAEPTPAGNTPPGILRWAGLVRFGLVQVVSLLGGFIQTPSFVCESVCVFQWCPAVFRCCSHPTVDIWLLFSLASGCRVIPVLFFSWLSAYYSVRSTTNAIHSPFQKQEKIGCHFKRWFKMICAPGNACVKIVSWYYFFLFFCLNKVI